MTGPVPVPSAVRSTCVTWGSAHWSEPSVQVSELVLSPNRGVVSHIWQIYITNYVDSTCLKNDAMLLEATYVNSSL